MKMINMHRDKHVTKLEKAQHDVFCNTTQFASSCVKHIVAVKTFTVVEADHTERVKSPSALREHVRRSLMSVETPKSPRQTVSSSFIKMLLGFISLEIFEICKAFKR